VTPVGAHQEQRVLHALPPGRRRSIDPDLVGDGSDIGQRTDVATPQRRRSGAGALGGAREDCDPGRLGPSVRANAHGADVTPLELVFPVTRYVFGERAGMNRIVAPRAAHLDEQPATNL
jgi:hypothetical protein